MTVGRVAAEPGDDGPSHVVLQPEGWPRPIGYANGMLAEGRIIVTGGVVGWDEQGVFASDFVGQARQTFNVAGRSVEMAAGETIHTENSYKYTLEGFAELADQAGWRVGARWVSPDPAFAVFLLQDWR